MNNKTLLFGIAGLCVSGFVSCTSENDKNEESPQKPNLLFIFADDQRADALGVAGNTKIHTPNIDALANSGVWFTNNYCMGSHHGAVSAPSRAMLMSGKYLFTVYDKLAGQTTLPMTLRDNGYTTFGTGKWHNEWDAFLKSFDTGKNVFLGGMSDHFQVPVRDALPDGTFSKPEKKGYSTDLFADVTIEFLNSYTESKETRPFFAYMALTAPHDPRSPKPEYFEQYPDEEMKLPDNFMELHPFYLRDLQVRDEQLAPWPRKHKSPAC